MTISSCPVFGLGVFSLKVCADLRTSVMGIGGCVRGCGSSGVSSFMRNTATRCREAIKHRKLPDQMSDSGSSFENDGWLSEEEAYQERLAHLRQHQRLPAQKTATFRVTRPPPARTARRVPAQQPDSGGEQWLSKRSSTVASEGYTFLNFQPHRRERFGDSQPQSHPQNPNLSHRGERFGDSQPQSHPQNPNLSHRREGFGDSQPQSLPGSPQTPTLGDFEQESQVGPSMQHTRERFGDFQQQSQSGSPTLSDFPESQVEPSMQPSPDVSPRRERWHFLASIPVQEPKPQPPTTIQKYVCILLCIPSYHYPKVCVYPPVP